MSESTIGVIGNTILSRSGIYFDFRDPKAYQIEITDIAQGLSNCCRFAGQTDFYSVAEHSVHVCDLIWNWTNDPEAALAALLHDASEAYMGDLPKPLKNMLPGFKKIEDRVQEVIFGRFGIEIGKHCPFIKKADLSMLKAEKRQLFPDHKEDWPRLDEIEDVSTLLQFWNPTTARRLFLVRFGQFHSKAFMNRQ